MSEEPDIPQPLPTIPRATLWILFSLPPMATLLGNLVASFYQTPGDYGTSFLPVPLVVLILIIVCLPFFSRIVGNRYRGRSLVFLNCAYLLGQIIVCLSLWVGTCLLVVS